MKPKIIFHSINLTNYPKDSPLLAKIMIDNYIITIYKILIIYLNNIIIGRFFLLSKEFFLNPQDPMQRRYESLRALVLEELLPEEVAQRFGYSLNTLRVLKREFQKNTLPSFFLPLKQGPKGHRTSTLHIKEQIISLRKRNYSIKEIQEALLRQGEEISSKTIYLLIEEEGFLLNSFAGPVPKEGKPSKRARNLPRWPRWSDLLNTKRFPLITEVFSSLFP